MTTSIFLVLSRAPSTYDEPPNVLGVWSILEAAQEQMAWNEDGFGRLEIEEWTLDGAFVKRHAIEDRWWESVD